MKREFVLVARKKPKFLGVFPVAFQLFKNVVHNVFCELEIESKEFEVPKGTKVKVTVETVEEEFGNE